MLHERLDDGPNDGRQKSQVKIMLSMIVAQAQSKPRSDQKDNPIPASNLHVVSASLESSLCLQRFLNYDTIICEGHLISLLYQQQINLK